MPPPPRAEVDRMPAPPPRALPPEFYRAPRGRVSPQQWIFALGGATLVLVVCACVALFALRGLPPTVSPTSPASNVIVLATSEPPKLLAPQEFAVTNQNLATAIANLNRVELKFVQDAQTAATNAATLDDDLREVAARAFIVAQTASALGLTAVAQDGGSDAAGQTAAQYYSIARLGYALVIEAQNARDGLPAGTLARTDAVNVIAEYGARLWNPAITDVAVKGNPFSPNVKEAANVAPVQFIDSNAVAQLKPRNISNWLATSQEVVTKTVNLLAPRAPVANPFDPTLLNILTTASGQSDAARARQVAAANLAMLTANPTSAPTQIQFAAFKSASIADASQIAAGVVPSFANGKASALAKRGAYPGGAEQLVGEMYLLNGQAPPRVEASTPVQETPPLVALSIAGVKETSRRRDAQGYLGVAFQVQVAWQTTFAAPRLYIVCAGGSAGKIVTSNSGSQQLSAYAYVNSQTREAEIRCEAHSPAGDFTMPNATAWMRVRVEETEKVAITAIPTDTLTPTLTRTPTLVPSATPTPTADKTQAALETQVAASKTAEFRATITEIARKTAQASQASVFTMNGTFSLNFLPVGWCEVGYDEPSFGTNTAGTIKITVDFKNGTASGSIKGGGSRGTYKLVWCDGSGSWDQTSRIDYEGTLSGTLDPATGTLSLLSVADLKYEISVANCQLSDGRSCSISPRTGLPTKLPITIKGTVDKTTRTGKGTVTVRNCMVTDHCVGDWHAGE